MPSLASVARGVQLAQIIFLRHWCEEHNAWADTAAQPRAATESLVTIPHSIQPFWLEFQAIVGGDVQARFTRLPLRRQRTKVAYKRAQLVLVGPSARLPGWSGFSKGRLRVTRLFSPTRSMRAPSWVQISPRQIPDLSSACLFCSFAPRNCTFHGNRPLGRLRRWLLFGRRLKFDFGGGAVKLALELISGFLEFPQTLANTSCELGKFFCTEEQHHYHKNEDSFGPAGHADSDWKTH
jgi:hypothetical protein